MRSFADTLPTLRGAAASEAPFPALKEGIRFDQNLALRALTGRVDPAPARESDADTAGTDVADIRRELLRRQSEAAGDRDAPAEATPRPFAPAPIEPALKRASPIQSFDDDVHTLDQQIDAAVAKAMKEAEADKAAAVELARQVERDVAARGIAEARRQWCEEEGVAFRASCSAAFDDLSARLSDAFGRALAPIAGAAIRDAAVRRFAAVIDDLVGDTADAPAVTVRGPADLIAALKQASREIGVVFEETDKGPAELRATVGDTTLQTTVTSWAHSLEATMRQADVGQE